MKRRMRRFYLFKVLPYIESRRWLRFCGLLLAWTAAASIFNIVMVWIMVVVQQNRCLQVTAAWAWDVCHSASDESLDSLGVSLATIAVVMAPAVVVLHYATAVAPRLPLAFTSPRAFRVALLLYLVCIATVCAVLFIWTVLW